MPEKDDLERERLLKKRQDFLDKVESESEQEISPKDLHSRGLRALQNQTRRQIVRFISDDVKTAKEIKDYLEIEQSQVDYHLSMLKQSFFVEKVENGWKLSDRGLGYLDNVESRQE